MLRCGSQTSTSGTSRAIQAMILVANAVRTRVSKQNIYQNGRSISGSNAIAFRNFWSAMSMNQLFPGAQWGLKTHSDNGERTSRVRRLA